MVTGPPDEAGVVEFWQKFAQFNYNDMQDHIEKILIRRFDDEEAPGRGKKSYVVCHNPSSRPQALIKDNLDAILPSVTHYLAMDGNL
jgi:hypothetical protein